MMRKGRDRAEAGRESGVPRGRWAWHVRTLLALRDHLRHEQGDRARDPADAMEPPSLHGADLIDDLYDRELAAALPADPEEALAEVDAALRRIAAGNYGVCESTGRRIAAARLRARPWCRRADVGRVRRCAAAKRENSHATKEQT
jgi:RNA polymerase-binding transcription factor DksA